MICDWQYHIIYPADLESDMTASATSNSPNNHFFWSLIKSAPQIVQIFSQSVYT